MKHKNLNLKIQNCTYAYQSYQHLLNTIKDMMRGGDFKPNILHTMMNTIDNHVTDNSPIIDKFLQKYDKNMTKGLMSNYQQTKLIIETNAKETLVHTEV